MSSRKQGAKSPAPTRKRPKAPPRNRVPGSPLVDDEREPLPDLVPLGMTPLQWRFANEYLIDLNATEAYLRANPDVERCTAKREGCRLTGMPMVRKEIQRLMDERAMATGITAQRVLVRLWEQATADHRELSELVVGACRHCWGVGHQYQYTQAEYDRALKDHEKAEIKREKANPKDFEPRQFDERGGIGFDANADPNPKCPECHGDGQARAVVKDSRKFSRGAALLYAGVKQTKDGIEVKTHDQQRALDMVGRHLGMWNDNIKVIPGQENPLMALLREIAESQGATLPVIANDPETANREMDDVTDVQAKPARQLEPAKKRVQWQPIKKAQT